MQEKNTLLASLPAARISSADLFKEVLGTYLVGVGEVPHYVAEYYRTFEKIVVLSQKCAAKTLVLLERPFWLDELFDRWMACDDTELARVFASRETPICGAAGIKFIKELRKINRRRRGSVICRCIDFYAKDPTEWTKAIKLLHPDKTTTAENKKLVQLLRAGKMELFSDRRENFMFHRAASAIKSLKPDRVLLFSGSFHAAKFGGKPFGKRFHRSLLSKLSERLKLKSISVVLFPLSGHYGRLRSTNGTILIEKKGCGALFRQGFKQEFRSLLRQTEEQIRFIDVSKLKYSGEHSAEFTELRKNHDFILSFKNISPDMR